MTIGMIGRKVGMTRIAEAGGKVVPVTVIHLAENTITQVKSADTDGYEAVQDIQQTLVGALLELVAGILIHMR